MIVATVTENVSIKIYYGICGDYFILQQVNITKTLISFQWQHLVPTTRAC